jgi:DNA replication protein DnaC
MCVAQQQEALERRERVARERRGHPEPIMRLCGIKQRYPSCSFESFKGGGGITTECIEFLNKPQDIVLAGGPGNGKTHLAVAIVRELVKELKINGPQDCVFITVPDLLLEIRSTFREESSTEKEIVEKYSSVPYLVLDDIGAEKSAEWSITTLYLIIDRRTSEELPTIYTTNLSLEEIDTKLSSRIASRMAYAKVLKNGMPDYRRKRVLSLRVPGSPFRKGAGPP